MSLHEVILPRTSDAMSEALLSSWLIDDGALVGVGDLIAEVETDKAMVEVAAESEGLVLHAVPAGSSVEVGAVLAYIVDGVEADAYREGTLTFPGLVSELPEASAATAITADEISAERTSSPVVPAATRPMAATVASPLARKLAREAGLVLESLAPGSGPGGRIVRADVEAAASVAPVSHVSVQPTLEKPSGRQAAMAAAMVESVTTIPHFSVSRDIEVQGLTEFRQQMKNIGATPPSFSTLFVMALGLALEQCPWARRTWSDAGIVFHPISAIGLAVADGETDLVVPILDGAERKSMEQVSAELEALIGRAKARRLNPEELTGGIGTISNLGMFGIDSLTPIIPPGQAFIIGLGRVREQRGDTFSTSVLTATLSGDHRVLTGVGAAMLLEAFAQMCANPVGLIAELRRAT